MLAPVVGRSHFGGKLLVYRGTGEKPVRFGSLPEEVEITVPQPFPVPNFGNYDLKQLDLLLKKHGGPWEGRPSANPWLRSFWVGDAQGDHNPDLLLMLGHHWDQGTHLVRGETWYYPGLR
jgi:hypothetical protein